MPETKPVSYPQDRTCPYRPPAGYDTLRTTRPLCRGTLYDGRSVWLVTGHKLARLLLAHPHLSTDRDHPDFPALAMQYVETDKPRLALLGVDDPLHRVQRRMVAHRFTLKRAVDLRPRIKQIVDGRLDAMITQGPPAELVSAFALPVASMVMCALLGVPYADHEFFEGQARRLHVPNPEDVKDARRQLFAHFDDLVERKQKETEPGDGVMDELVHQQLREGEVDREYVVALMSRLLTAGFETSANMISLSTFTLLQHPKQHAELLHDPELMPKAVDELLRVLSVADGLKRRATKDIEAEGTTIRAGDGVIFATSIINRDEDRYPAPDTLDWHRSHHNHVAFGHGIHQCLGQNLARAELEIALRTLFERLPGLRLAAPANEIPIWPGEEMFQGLQELPVAW
ncbi:cytochrome P450 [Streptomyces sp. NPDC059680]|uniref:cytochrome P450 n=1 Tax=Streptomyces sp. NPDC059680 TaxID=3346904 RepID=UPI00367C4AC3